MDDIQTLNTNDEIIAYENQRVQDNFAKRMANPDLMALRAQLPFVEIMPMPNMVLSVALKASTAVDIDLPSGTKLVLFNGNGDYFINRRGGAVIPTNTLCENTGNMYKPNQSYFYIEEGQQLSAISVADSFLTISCFAQL